MSSIFHISYLLMGNVLSKLAGSLYVLIKNMLNIFKINFGRTIKFNSIFKSSSYFSYPTYRHTRFKGKVHMKYKVRWSALSSNKLMFPFPLSLHILHD